MAFRGVFCQAIVLTAGLAITVLLGGCSISDSVGSISKSSESISDSSKSSSKGDDKEVKNNSTARFEIQIRDYTIGYLYTNKGIRNQNDFMSGISDIANEHGIVDWESNPKTFQAIGAGLKRANIGFAQYAAYRQKLTSGNLDKMADIQLGYEK